MIRQIDNYRLIAELKRGPQVAVYRAFEEKLQRFVLVKILQVTDPATSARFEKEALFLASLKHPNIVQVLNTGVTRPHAGKVWPYLALEFIEGFTLAEIAQNRKLPPDVVIYLCREILGALSAAHRRKIVHRDLKPQNILIDTEGRVKLTDFGLAATIEAEGNGEIAGTPQYMSPEQARGEAVTPASDFFSLGVMMYEMLSGVSPFDGETVAERIYRVTHERPAPLSNLANVPSSRLLDLVHRLLEKNPQLRPAAAEEVLREFELCETELRQRARAADMCRYLKSPGSYTPANFLPKATLARRAWRYWASAALLIAIGVGSWQIVRRNENTARERVASALLAAADAKTAHATLPAENKTATDSAARALSLQNLARQQNETDSRHEDQSSPPRTTASESVTSLNDGGNGRQPEAALEEIESEPPSAPVYGVVRITCLPVAEAVINADTLGMVDISPGYFQIAAGEHWLTLLNPRFPPYKKQLHVIAGDTTELAVSLWETVGILKLFVQPWAEVKIDGAGFGKTPLGDILLAPGEHTIFLHHPDREVLVVTRRFFAGQRDTLSIDLRQKY